MSFGLCETGFWLTLEEPLVAEDDSDSTYCSKQTALGFPLWLTGSSGAGGFLRTLSRVAAAAFLVEALGNSTLIRIFLKIAT